MKWENHLSLYYNSLKKSKAFSCSYNKNGKFAMHLRTARTEAKEDPEEGEIGLELDVLWEWAQHH